MHPPANHKQVPVLSSHRFPQPNMSLSLTQQTVLITGASSGIGAALAQTLAGQFPGIRLVLTARRGDRLDTLAARCRAAGAEVLAIPADISQPDQTAALVEKVLHAFGRVDALVNNVGFGQMGPIELLPAASIEQQFAVNLFGPLALTRALIPTMRGQGGGRIINVSSLGGRLAFPFIGVYSASKFALEALSDVLRMELDPFNIRVSIVEPGPVATEFVEVAKTQIDAAIPNPLDTPYRAAFQKVANLDQQLARQAWSAEQVAVVIVKALSDRHPHPRYIAATGGKLLLFIMSLFPTRLADRFWQRFYGIDLVAKEWKSKNRPNR